MRAMVVYESMFGCTEHVAEAVAEGLREGGLADGPPEEGVLVVEVGHAPPLDAVDTELLVVGGPTHAFGMSLAGTRADAARQGPVVSTGPGIREWLGSGELRTGTRVAAFDTHVRHPDLPGHASHAASRRLRRLGGSVVAHPHSFAVEGTVGPLSDGELGRAREWGRSLAATVPVQR